MKRTDGTFKMEKAKSASEQVGAVAAGLVRNPQQPSVIAAERARVLPPAGAEPAAEAEAWAATVRGYVSLHPDGWFGMGECLLQPEVHDRAAGRWEGRRLAATGNTLYVRGYDL